MQHLLVFRDLHDRAIREHGFHALDEGRPLIAAVEVVHHQETAAQKVLAQLSRRLFIQRPLPDLNAVDPGVLKDLVGLEVDVTAALSRVNAGQSANAVHEVVFGLRPIGRPGIPAATAPAVAGIGQAGEEELRPHAVVGESHAGRVVLESAAATSAATTVKLSKQRDGHQRHEERCCEPRPAESSHQRVPAFPDTELA